MVGNFEMSWLRASAVGMSSFDMPISSVAQKTMPSESAKSPNPSISSARPSSPCP
jgi:hypothetical protein